MSQDVFFTPSIGLSTTLGSAAFAKATGCRDADVVTLLLQAGAIIVGKANLSVGKSSRQGSPAAIYLSRNLGTTKDRASRLGGLSLVARFVQEISLQPMKG